MVFEGINTTFLLQSVSLAPLFQETEFSHGWLDVNLGTGALSSVQGLCIQKVVLEGVKRECSVFTVQKVVNFRILVTKRGVLLRSSSRQCLFLLSYYCI